MTLLERPGGLLNGGWPVNPGFGGLMKIYKELSGDGILSGGNSQCQAPA